MKNLMNRWRRASLKIDCVSSFAKKVSQLIKAEWNQIVFLFALSVQLVFSESLAILKAVVFKPRKKSFYLLSSVLILLIQKEESSESNPRKKSIGDNVPEEFTPTKAGPKFSRLYPSSSVDSTPRRNPQIGFIISAKGSGNPARKDFHNRKKTSTRNRKGKTEHHPNLNPGVGRMK